MKAAKLHNEAQRLAALARYAILDTQAEPEFDAITRLVAQICDVPIAVINFVDCERQWFKSEVGLGVRSSPFDGSICAHALLEADMLVVHDTLNDPRFANNPLVLRGPRLRFYAGTLLRTDDGFALGTLCVLDNRPRTLSPLQIETLQCLARQVMQLLELRRSRTLQARAVAEQALAEQALADERRRSALGKLAGGVAHELNNAMMLVLGCGEIALAELAADHSARREVEEMVRAAERAADVTRQVLAYGRASVTRRTAVDLNEAVRGMAPRLQRLVGAAITLRFHLAPMLQAVLADARQLEQVLVQLVQNASEALEGREGACIDVRTGNLPTVVASGDAATAPEEAKAERCFQLVVSDNGPGMAPEVAARALEPFFTTKPFGAGPGLGLSTVQGIMQQSGGEVVIQTGLGAGTTVSLLLLAAPPEATDNAAPPVQPLPTGTARILVVESDAQLRVLLARALTDQGFDVVTAPEGHTALALLEQLGEVKLVVTDLLVPRMDGYLFAQHLANERPWLPVLFTSDPANPASTLPGKENILIEKPFSSERLVQEVRRVLSVADSAVH